MGQRWISQRRDEVSNLVRDLQHSVWHTSCDATVLFEAAKEVRTGATVLGYAIPEVPRNRDRDFYRDWIKTITDRSRHNLYWWAFLDCSLDNSEKAFKAAATRVGQCQTALNDIQDDEPYCVPAVA